MQRTSILTALTVLAFSVIFQAAQAATPDSFSSAQELTRSDGTPYFLGAAQIESLLQASYDSLGPGGGVVTSEQLAHELFSDLVERSKSLPESISGSCVQPRFSAHRELRYVRPPEEFEDPESALHQTVIDLASRAPEVAVVRIKEAYSGLFGIELGTLARVEVEEWIKKNPDIEASDEPKYLLISGVWLKIAGTQHCQARPGSAKPEPGARFVVLGFRSPAVEGLFDAGNLFPLDDEIILPQPYPLMESPLPTSLMQLRSSLE